LFGIQTWVGLPKKNEEAERLLRTTLMRHCRCSTVTASAFASSPGRTAAHARDQVLFNLTPLTPPPLLIIVKVPASNPKLWESEFRLARAVATAASLKLVAPL